MATFCAEKGIKVNLFLKKNLIFRRTFYWTGVVWYEIKGIFWLPNSLNNPLPSIIQNHFFFVFFLHLKGRGRGKGDFRFKKKTTAIHIKESYTFFESVKKVLQALRVKTPCILFFSIERGGGAIGLE